VLLAQARLTWAAPAKEGVRMKIKEREQIRNRMPECGPKKFLKIKFTNFWGAGLKIFKTIPPLA
jgi:hypothetical protein